MGDIELGRYNILFGWIGLTLGILLSLFIEWGLVRNGTLVFKRQEDRGLCQMAYLSFLLIPLISIAYGMVVGWYLPYTRLLQLAGRMLMASWIILPAGCFLYIWKKQFVYILLIGVLCVLIPLSLITCFHLAVFFN